MHNRSTRADFDLFTALVIENTAYLDTWLHKTFCLHFFAPGSLCHFDRQRIPAPGIRARFGRSGPHPMPGDSRDQGRKAHATIPSHWSAVVVFVRVQAVAGDSLYVLRPAGHDRIVARSVEVVVESFGEFAAVLRHTHTFRIGVQLVDFHAAHAARLDEKSQHGTGQGTYVRRIQVKILGAYQHIAWIGCLQNQNAARPERTNALVDERQHNVKRQMLKKMKRRNPSHGTFREAAQVRKCIAVLRLQAETTARLNHALITVHAGSLHLFGAQQFEPLAPPAPQIHNRSIVLTRPGIAQHGYIYALLLPDLFTCPAKGGRSRAYIYPCCAM